MFRVDSMEKKSFAYRVNLCVIRNTKTGAFFGGWKRLKSPRWLRAQNDKIKVYRNKTDLDLQADFNVLMELKTYARIVKIVELG